MSTPLGKSIAPCTPWSDIRYLPNGPILAPEAPRNHERKFN